MPTVTHYNQMLADSARMAAYCDALRRAVKPGAVVVDIGTGTGVMAMLACRFGARRVYAIEPMDAIDVAKRVAAENGYADRIEFIKEMSTRVTLPERADVVVSDLRGVLPWYGDHIQDVIDARQRFLAEDGVLIPQRDLAWAALVEAPEHYHKVVGVCSDNFLGLDMTPTARFATNSVEKVELEPGHLLAEPEQWATLDYRTVDSPDVTAQLSWTTARTGTAHGFVVWFDGDLLDGVGFSNAPGRRDSIYGQVLFPFSEPVDLVAQGRVFAELRARVAGGHYVWRWRTRFAAPRMGDAAGSEFDQSTLLGDPVPVSRIHRGQADHRPELDSEGEIDQFVLSLMNGETELRQIADRVRERFPDGFPTPEAALRRVIVLSDRYSRW